MSANRDDDWTIERVVCPRDYDPHRGPLIKALGLIGLVGGVAFLLEALPLIVEPYCEKG